MGELQPQFAFGSQQSGSGIPVLAQDILTEVPDPKLQAALLTGAGLEGGIAGPWTTANAGDGGTSFGPFQMHIGGALGDLPGNQSQQIQEALDPQTALSDWAIGAYSGALGSVDPNLWNTNPQAAAEETAALAEQPAANGGPESQAYYSQGRDVAGAFQTAQGLQQNPPIWNGPVDASGAQAGVAGTTVSTSQPTKPATTVPVANPSTDTDFLSSLDDTLNAKGFAFLNPIDDAKVILSRGTVVVFGLVIIGIALYELIGHIGSATDSIQGKANQGQKALSGFASIKELFKSPVALAEVAA